MGKSRQLTGRSFASNEDGAVAIIFALSVIVLFLITGLAIDIGRIMHAERKIANAVDAAALSAAKSLRDGRSTDAQINTIATEYFNDNMKGSGGNIVKIKSLNVQIDHVKNAVSVGVTTEVPTLFFNIAGFRSVDIPKSSIAIYDTKDIELGLQLDVTGSMAGRKLTELKSAVGDLLDIMYPSSGTTNKVRIGLAPFAAGVNAGTYASAVSGGRSTNGCIYERRLAADQSSDIAPTGTHALKAKADLPSADPCPSSAKVLAMTDDKALIKTTVNGWASGGTTAGHLGAAWAWYLVSPEWASIWPTASKPAAYNDGKSMKAVILMTDGIYNTVGGASNGDFGSTAAQSTSLAQDTCVAMRGKGIVVYTIGFEAPAAAKTALRNCASDSAKFYDAADGNQLRAAFQAIAAELNNLRLSF